MRKVILLKTIIYADVLFFGNLVIDFILLYTANGFLHRRAKWYKLLIGSFLFALYSVFMFYPQIKLLYCTAAKIAVSLLVLLLVFRPAGWRDFGKTLAVFYLVNFLYGGIVFLLLTFGRDNFFMAISNGELYLSFSTVMLLAAVFAGLIAVRTGLELIVKNLAEKKLYQDFILHMNGQKVLLHGFVDTGNHLTDPKNGNGVIVVSYDKIREFLPAELKAVLDGEADDTLFEKAPSLVPFKSIGKENGVLFGFEPDSVELLERERRQVRHVTVCPSRQAVPADKSFDAIINPKILI